MLPGNDIDGELGTLDVIAMDEVRSAFTGLDGLIDGVGFQNLADPRAVQVYFVDGIGDATDCRFDIRWYRRGYYSVHHTDSSDRNFRWDYHPKVGLQTSISIRHPIRRRRMSNSPVSRPNSRLSSPERFTSYGVGPTIPGAPQI